VTDTPRTLGSINVELLARVGGREPVSLGYVAVPLTVKSAGINQIEGDLAQAANVARVTLEKIFKEPES
jgi:hypothetical protein